MSLVGRIRTRTATLRHPGTVFAMVTPCVQACYLALSVSVLASDHAASRADQQDLSHWAFNPPRMPVIPEVQHVDLIHTPIDRFIQHRLEDAGLRMNPTADKRTLIRRAYIDLIGVLPSPDEIDVFLSDTAPDAYERLIDRLLASPHYGERWGRHWLDVAGYADSNGILVDAPIPEIWKYRDYVIRSFNADKPYDRFLLEQFAGDELVDWRDSDHMTDAMVESLTATGFLRCTPDGTDNQAIYQVDKRWDRVHVAVEVAMKAAMGINLNCARCHDHKFDPITQQEYYQVLGLFTPAYNLDQWIPTNDFRNYGWPLRYVIRGGKDEREATQRRLAELATLLKDFPGMRSQLIDRYHERWLQQLFQDGELELSIEERQALAIPQETRSDEIKELIERLLKQHQVNPKTLSERFPELDAELARLEQQRKERQAEQRRLEDRRILALWDLSGDPPVVRLLNRGDFLDPGKAVRAGVPQSLDDEKTPFTLPAPTQNSTRWRLALADWLVRPEHPLTARVIANRVWHYHFGQGIVATPDDFGAQGARPSHPELLDWMALWLVEKGWSLKQLHKLIMTSHVYRQSAATNAVAAQRDPANELLWRWESRRLEAEVIRDCMLVTGGRLNREMFGPPVPVKQATDGQFVVDAEHPGCYRRSVYLMQRRTMPVTLLEVFDLPVMDTNQPHRFRSTVPLQSLALLNNDFLRLCSEYFAARLEREGSTDINGGIERAFEIALGRLPEPEEMDISRQLIESIDDAAAGWKLFCHGLLASNEFLYVD